MFGFGYIQVHIVLCLSSFNQLFEPDYVRRILDIYSIQHCNRKHFRETE